MVLTWKIDITPAIDERWIYFINAIDGQFIHRIKNIHKAVVVASGEDITLYSPGHLRSLANPASGLSPQPTKMSEYENMPNDEDNYFGGVHVNSGIPNRAAYLIAEGLTTESLGTSIGRGDAEDIYYLALTTYLTASSNFLDARNALVQAATDLYGESSTQVAAVNRAFDVVEVTSGSSSGPDDTSPTGADTISGEDVMAYLSPLDGSHNTSGASEEYSLNLQNLTNFSPYSSDDEGILHYIADSSTNPRYTRPAIYTDSNGTTILWVGEDYNIHSIDSNASNYTQITTSGDILSIAVSPDGRFIAYTSAVEGNNIYLYDIAGSTTYSYAVALSSNIFSRDRRR